MQFSAVLVAAVAATGALADLHNVAWCYSQIQPYGNDNSCTGSAKRTTDEHFLEDRDLAEMVKRDYADNRAATIAACNAYRNRNTGSEQWDTCPDCTMAESKTQDSNFCIDTCTSAAWHIGGDEWEYYCKQNGADGGYAS